MSKTTPQRMPMSTPCTACRLLRRFFILAPAPAAAAVGVVVAAAPGPAVAALLVAGGAVARDAREVERLVFRRRAGVEGADDRHVLVVAHNIVVLPSTLSASVVPVTVQPRSTMPPVTGV
jgi:hypothetical protein